MAGTSLELCLAPDPFDEWQRMLRFVSLKDDERGAMARTIEALLLHANEMVVQTYDYLQSFPETAEILGWETGVDVDHLEERRRFFTIWLTRTLGLDTSEEFARYLFRAGQYHAGHGPRRIHTPAAYVICSMGLVISSFAQYMTNAGLPAETIALALAGWNKYLTVQLNQMLFGYQIAKAYESGDIAVRFQVYGRLRPMLGDKEFIVHAQPEAKVADVLAKFINYHPQLRHEALQRVWDSEEKPDSLWVQVTPRYVPLPGWRVLLNGRDLYFDSGFETPLAEHDEIAIFPPGR